MNRKLPSKLLKLDKWQRRLYLVALLTKELKKYNIRPVLVGGNALEFYTLGGYATGDIDLVLSDTIEADKFLSCYGFKKIDRMWVNEEFDLFVEFPSSNLREGENDRVVQVKLGKKDIYVIGVEDLIIDRLNAYVWWKSEDEGYWVKELLLLFKDKLDKKYLYRCAKRDKVLSSLKKLIKQVYSKKWQLK